MKNNPLPGLNYDEGCIVLLNKEENWTSFDVVKKVRGILRLKKVGHAGTLDPFATGLLIIGAGKGTKMLTELTGLSKTYRARIRFGMETDTYDRTGQVIRSLDHFTLSQSGIGQALQRFTGKIEQIPPMFSAKKINGRPLYQLARKGVEVNRKAVQAEIYRAEILSWEFPFLTAEFHVSKGTYIRTLAHDIGRALGVGGVVDALHRTEIGSYRVEDSFTVNEFKTVWENISA